MSATAADANRQGARIVVRGVGAVSPAGWGIAPMLEAIEAGEARYLGPAEKEGAFLAPPKPESRFPWLRHARLRRSSPISQFLVAASLEAMELEEIPEEASALTETFGRVGVIVSVMNGCVNFSKRFYQEALEDPSTASPILFPETVFNAPSSHLAALLGLHGMNYTVLGDGANFLEALAVGAQWLLDDLADHVLIAAAEEPDSLTAQAHHLIHLRQPVSSGAGAVFLSRERKGIAALEAITGVHLINGRQSRAQAARAMKAELDGTAAGGSGQVLLCDGLTGYSRFDDDEAPLWENWCGPRISPKRTVGEGLGTSGAWQVVSALGMTARQPVEQAWISCVGVNEQVIGAIFTVA